MGLFVKTFLWTLGGKNATGVAIAYNLAKADLVPVDIYLRQTLETPYLPVMN